MWSSPHKLVAHRSSGHSGAYFMSLAATILAANWLATQSTAGCDHDGCSSHHWKRLGWVAFDVNVGEGFTEFTTIGQNSVPSASPHAQVNASIPKTQLHQGCFPTRPPQISDFVHTNRGREDCCDASYATLWESQTGDQKMMMLNSWLLTQNCWNNLLPNFLVPLHSKFPFSSTFCLRPWENAFKKAFPGNEASTDSTNVMLSDQ